MPNRSPDQSNGQIKVYVRPNGARYVKASDVLGSPQGRKAVKAMSKLLSPDSRVEPSDAQGGKS